MHNGVAGPDRAPALSTQPNRHPVLPSNTHRSALKRMQLGYPPPDNRAGPPHRAALVLLRGRIMHVQAIFTSRKTLPGDQPRCKM
jgi:hypothetical protein